VIDADELVERSGLPGPRANLSLLAEVAEVLPEADARRFLAHEHEFVVMCGVVALGRLAGGGHRDVVGLLRSAANDERWRVREAVAMALQRWGDDDFDGMANEAEAWADGTPLERRAAAAGLCEPRLLTSGERVCRALRMLERVTRDPHDLTLRKGLGYCWSVAVAADPEQGLPAFERLQKSTDPDVQWIVRENLKKKRLRRLVQV
jgi:hypothetical protein